MKPLALQMVIVELENGKCGIFVGLPLVCNEAPDADCQVENVWFTDVHDLPESTTLEQLTCLAREQMERYRATLQ
jgi:hypothetical protein